MMIEMEFKIVEIRKIAWFDLPKQERSTIEKKIYVTQLDKWHWKT